MRIFLAGATGAIGRRLVPLLIGAGHEVAGMTRSPERAAQLASQGAQPVEADIYDAPATVKAVVAFRSDLIVSQLSDLPQVYDLATYDAAVKRNADIWKAAAGTLIEAARAAGVGRMVAQGLAFAYAPGAEPYSEDHPLDLSAEGTRAVMVAGTKATEDSALRTPGIAGIVLRYGYFYGPGTWRETPTGKPSLHVDAAAEAALLAVERGEPGVYNIANDDGAVSIDKSRRILGFDPAFRLPERAHGHAA